MKILALIRAIPGATAMLSESIPTSYMHNLRDIFLGRPHNQTLEESCDYIDDISSLAYSQDRMRLIDCACYLLVARIVSSSPRMPLRVGSQLSVLAHGPLGEASLVAPSFKEVLALWQAYFPGVLPFIETGLTTEENAISFSLKTSVPLLIFRRDLMELLISALARSVRDCVGDDTRHDFQLMLDWERPDHWRDYSRFLGIPVQFNATELRLVVRKSRAEEPLRMSNSAACAAALERLQSRHPTPRQRSPLSHRIAAWLARSAQLPAQADAARHFHMSPRALRSRLRREGTSYQDLKLTVQLSRAMDLLAQTDLNLGLVAEQAGFNSSSTLSRAFRRRHNMSPSEFRRIARPGNAASAPAPSHSSDSSED